MLLPLVVFSGMARAQDITNTARAEWSFGGVDFSVESNTIVTTRDALPPQIRTFRPGAGGTPLEFPAPLCPASAGDTASNGIASARTAGGTLSQTVEQSSILRAGQPLVYEVRAASANVDPGAVDSLTTVITTSTGDRETIIIYETGANTGLFIGQIATRRIPPPVRQDDCALSLTNGSTIQIAVLETGGTATILQAQVEVLVDPFGILFDSETGEAVSGGRVTLVEAATGLPATVFAEDGVTRWPSTVIAGQPITDASGNVYPMEDGEYWFPLTFLGNYRLLVEPPGPYSHPSVVSPEQIARLSRPGGGQFVIVDASYGDEVALVSRTPVQIDIPLDRPGVAVAITKTASRADVQPGDAVFYTVTVRNPDAVRAKQDVILVDTPSPSLRLRKDSVRIDGTPAPQAATFAPDGSTLTLALGDIAGGATRRITYAMTVRSDAPAGTAENRAEAIDSRGRNARASATVNILRDIIVSRMTIIGRITAGDCRIEEAQRIGIPGIRVMMEDGSFAVTDAQGRYHFEGVVPGTHVVQAARMTLPEGGEFVDCSRSTRNAGSATSRFVIGRGGSLVVADFHAILTEAALAEIAAAAPVGPGELALNETVENESDLLGGTVAPAQLNVVNAAANDASSEAEIGVRNWLELGDGPDGWLFPGTDYNPRAPATRVAIRHRPGQKVVLRANGKKVEPLSFEGMRTSADKAFSVSQWRGVMLPSERTQLTADILNADGTVAQSIERMVYFTSLPNRAELVRDQSLLIADGRTRPVIAVRMLDRRGRPVRAGVSGEFTINAPYQSASQIEAQQLRQLTGLGGASARWLIQGNDGIARIELAPTMVSGSLDLDFAFSDGDITRTQKVESWIEPGDIEWTVVGLAEGTVGARSVADNMQRSGSFDSDLGNDARVALYAKGRVLGKYLLTLSYDSAKQRDNQRLLGTIDPNAYYTVYADASSRRFDAASREKLYLRIETATFYALYGDFTTGFDQTSLARYNRTATGVKAEARLGAVQVQGFAAEVATRYRRDEIQGAGITGPYRLGSRRLVPNSEQVAIETRDRFRSEIIIERRELTRFIDYDIDLLSGTITFKAPVTSRDFDLNPQFIIVDYEVDELSGDTWNAGARATFTNDDDSVRLGATIISDKGDDERTNIAAVDARIRIGDATEVRAELAASRRDGETSTGWMVEAEHRTGNLDVLAYARSLEADYGVGQQSGAERGRRKVGVDARVQLSDQLSVVGSVWQDDSMTDTARRRAAQVQGTYSADTTDLRLGLTHFTDRLPDSTINTSTVLEGGITKRLLDNRLELSSTSSIGLGTTESIDLPSRHRFGARYAVTSDVALVGVYEIANGETIDARTFRAGVEASPWTGGKIVTALGQQDIGELGNRSYAAFGLAQTMQVSPTLVLDASIDGSRTLNSSDEQLGLIADIVNPAQPVASGGQLGQDGTFFEDFTAISLGAAYRKDRWSATGRAEYRDGEFADRTGVTLGAIRQLGEGSIVGSGFTYTRAEGENGATTEILDGAIALAHRPAASEVAFLGKLEYRSDAVTNAVAGDFGPTGRTALLVNGDARSRRAIASLSTNWSPHGTANYDVDGDGTTDDVEGQVRREEYSLFLGGRYNFDSVEGFDLEGFTALAGLDARIGVGEHIELGGSATVRANLTDNTTSFAFGPQIGVVPADGVLVTLGYNISGFRDPDFSAARNTDKGVYAAVRLKFDADTFGFLGLGR
ncbi:isopeptide-forming domain-containing fimbrial protein [Alteripontixanthobacter maritimus]|uniref:isopeptide-forming domain-containing fimbrial protein n=1 Tax=Alteripontixanthobacter maritimus TaxID=2161824 RepID=UPI001E6540E7|nr:isopeptide-forming domain-containing fimbrial protein [Alteripontixanthobacter maritimus]